MREDIRLTPDDERAFARLEDVHMQYDQYLELTKLGSVILQPEPPPTPPEPARHLTLVFSEQE